jgi:hypothetical protein
MRWLLRFGMVAAVTCAVAGFSVFHASFELRSSRYKFCSSGSKNLNARDLNLKMAMTPEERKAFKNLGDQLTSVTNKLTSVENKLTSVSTELSTVAGEVQTLAGIRAIIVAARVLLIHIGKQPRILKSVKRYFNFALNDPTNPDYGTMLESVFGAADSISKSEWTDRFDATVASRNLGAHPSDLGELSVKAAKLAQILQRRVMMNVKLEKDEQTALEILSRYQQVSQAPNRAKLILIHPTP